MGQLSSSWRNIVKRFGGLCVLLDELEGRRRGGEVAIAVRIHVDGIGQGIGILARDGLVVIPKDAVIADETVI